MPRPTRTPLILLLCGAAIAANADAPDVPDDVDSTASFGDWDVRFTDATPYDCTMPPPPGADLDFLPFSVARDMLDAITGSANVLPNEPPNFLTAYAELGFGPALFDLDFSDDTELFAYNCAPGSGVDPDCDTATAGHDYMAWAATRNCMSSEARTRFIAGHEIFHYIQYGYVGFDLSDWGSTAVEGTARMMEDQVYVDLDAANTFVFSDAQNYLVNPNRSIWSLGEDLGYQSVLAWKYAAEQFGNVRDEPRVGVDFIRRFWERADAAEDDPSTPRVFGETLLEFTGNSLTTGDHLDASLAWFQRFAHTNLVRRYDLSGLTPAL
ncbi:MAG: hypothetical protein AAFX85_07490 [Pseudomonadota bacterium]